MTLRKLMVKELQEILPYNKTWYSKLSNSQVIAIWIKYVNTPNKFEDAKINDCCNLENSKVLVKRKVENSIKYILADNGNWEEEFN